MQTQIQKIYSRIGELAGFRRIATDVLRGDGDVVVSGLTGASRALFLAGLWPSLQRPLIVVLPHDRTVDGFAADLSYFHEQLNGRPSESVCPFPGWEIDPYSGISPHASVQQARAAALWRLRRKRADFIVCSIRGFCGRLTPPALFDSYSLQLAIDDELSQELLAEHLVAAGYLRQDSVGAVGEFSIRGGIVDVFSPGMASPARIEFFGDSVDSIREFDLDDQRSRTPTSRIDLLPMQDTILSAGMLREWAIAARARWADGAFARDLDEKTTFAGDGQVFPGAPFLVPSSHPLQATLLDYASLPVLVFDELEVIEEAVERFFSILEKRFGQTEQSGRLALRPSELFLDAQGLKALAAKQPRLHLEEIGPASPSCFVQTQPVSRFHGRVKDLIDTIRSSHQEDREVVLLGSTLGMAERLRDIVHEYGIPFRAEFGDQPLAARVVDERAPVIGIGHLSAGFRLPESGIEVYVETDLFDENEHAPPPRQRKKLSALLSDLQDLKPGDYVVHVDHGIGAYGGVTLVHDRECMIVTYQGSDRLYVPLERLDLIEKYSAGEGVAPQIDKLGGTTWVARKARVKRAIRDMAQELLKLYAERKTIDGYAFSADSDFQKEFEDAFPYEETPDQLTAIQEIKRDMEAPRPMDRLVCGDVGYGKTEVAMRATFKAVGDSKQVAVLAPTTVLCYQHFETFRERFAAFPVRIAMMSRFVATKDQKKVLEDLESGKVDILVGTHRLLSRDVRFSDLGLLVVDEEQRFGVAHKERLKQLRTAVDVITLTATPIPRTLQMGLSGLRDMSVIETPPRDRLAIQTSVVKFNPAVIQNAIESELERGGQIYVVHNRVESIYSLASFVQKLCPKARVGVGHGQMGEKDLERLMTRFMHHEFDVLVATTIIENGLDIPLANTMIVNRADRFGLSQLYQLRGRIGRSNRRAYAYLLIPPDTRLTPVARRRLAAIREFSELGAGFRIAALDLELRGAGNLLGGQQHGHIEAVGFDLYCQMLERTIDELRGGEARPEVETAINLKVDLKMPASFVEDEMQRLRLYKQIASCRSVAEVGQFCRDLEDRFGELPVQVRNLLEYARLRVIGRNLGVMAFDRTVQGVDIRFHESARIEPERVLRLVETGPAVSFLPPSTLRLKIGGTRADLFETVERVLEELC